MIVKRIPAQSGAHGRRTLRAAHVRQLVDYLHSPDKESEFKEYLVAYMASQKLDHGPERLLHIGARNFLSESVEGQRAEMMAVAQAAVRSQNPIDHWLLSWREGERPSPEQVDAAVAMFLAELGMSGHQCIYAMHGDTHNAHVHIALNRYDPWSRRVVTINKGFYKEVAHQAVAKIVDHFGWQAEQEARYVMSDGKVVLSDAARSAASGGLPKLNNVSRAAEVRTGYRSAQRVGQEVALQIIHAATSWKSLHEGLAREGITYETVGTNGALMTISDRKVKASAVSRGITVTKLEARLGRFEPARPDIEISLRDPSHDRLPQAFRADEYRRERDQWSRMPPVERKRLGMKRPAPNLETHLHRQREPWFAERWRRRSPAFEEMDGFDGSPGIQTQPRNMDGFEPYPCAEGIRYARGNGATAFIDLGKSVVVPPGNDDALLAALRLSILKFDGRVRVRGSMELQERVWTLAVQHGLEGHLTNAEFVQRREARCQTQLDAEQRMATPQAMAKALSTESAQMLDRALKPDQVIAPKPAWDRSAINAAAERQKQEAIGDWTKDFEERIGSKALPVAFDGDRPVLEIERLDEDQRRFADIFSHELQPWLEGLVQAKREKISEAVRANWRDAREQMSGRTRWNPFIFERELQDTAIHLLEKDPAMAGLRGEIEARLLRAKTDHVRTTPVRSGNLANNAQQAQQRPPVPIQQEDVEHARRQREWQERQDRGR